MGLACVDGVGVGADVWARRGPKSRSAGRVSRRLFGTSSAGDPGRNIEFARQQLSSEITADSATWNFDFKNMAPLSGPFSWSVTSSAPCPYLPQQHTAPQTQHTAPHTHTQLPDSTHATHTHHTHPTTDPITLSQPNAPTQLAQGTDNTYTQIPNANTQIPTNTQIPNTHTQIPNTHTLVPNTPNTHTQLPNTTTANSEDLHTNINTSTTSFNASSHTTCLTATTRCPSPTSAATSPSGKPVKRLQQRSTPAKVQSRKITDYFTEVRTPRVKSYLKTGILDSTAPQFTSRGANLRREETDAD